jgi:uncharacterized protein
MIARHFAITSITVAAATIAFGFGATAQEKVLPSFDCIKETGTVEQAICGSPELSRLDVDMAQSYKVAIDALNAIDTAALRDDQRAWVAGRPALLAKGFDELKSAMEDRVAMQGTALNAYPLLGMWANHRTSISIRDRRGLIIEPADERCNNLGAADYAGDGPARMVGSWPEFISRNHAT